MTSIRSGLWIGVDVATGVALAAGGFTSSALVYIFNREHFHAVIRPALLTALLGYTFVGIGLMFDLGRWYNIWHPAVPFMWQGNSVLFEVGMCVMIYLTVLYIEFVPVVCERFIGRVNLPGMLGRFNDSVDMALRFADHILGRIMFLFIIAGDGPLLPAPVLARHPHGHCPLQDASALPVAAGAALLPDLRLRGRAVP